MKQADRIILDKMIGYCDDIMSMVSEFGDSFETFTTQKSYRYATSMCILQIGELINRLSAEIISQNVQIPWRMIRSMRNVFAHTYDKAELDLMWETVKEDVPALKAQLLEITAKE